MYHLTLTGSPIERGRAHGEALREPILQQIAFLRGLIASQTDIAPDAFFAHLLNLGWRTAAEHWAPDLLEEVRGIAQGANLPFADLFAWNHVQEIVWYIPIYKAGRLASDLGCSMLGDPGEAGHPTILAQNADTIPQWYGQQTLLRICLPGSDLELLMMTYPGLVGVYGLNNRGVGICVNALFYDLNNSTGGLGTPLMTRSILSQGDGRAAETFLRRAPHASGNTLTLAYPGQVTAFEVSANQVQPYFPADKPGRVYHTNHICASTDFRSGGPPTPYPNSVDRQALLAEGLARVRRPLTVEDARAILQTHGEKASLCRHEDDPHGSMTTYCMIMECSSRPVLHVAFGPPCRAPFHTYTFP